MCRNKLFFYEVITIVYMKEHDHKHTTIIIMKEHTQSS